MECSNVRTFYEMYSDKLRNFQGENGVFFKKLFQKTFKCNWMVSNLLSWLEENFACRPRLNVYNLNLTIT